MERMIGRFLQWTLLTGLSVTVSADAWARDGISACADRIPRGVDGDYIRAILLQSGMEY